jgi:hypothetical protein
MGPSASAVDTFLSDDCLWYFGVYHDTVHPYNDGIILL